MILITRSAILVALLVSAGACSATSGVEERERRTSRPKADESASEDYATESGSTSEVRSASVERKSNAVNAEDAKRSRPAVSFDFFPPRIESDRGSDEEIIAKRDDLVADYKRRNRINLRQKAERNNHVTFPAVTRDDLQRNVVLIYQVGGCDVVGLQSPRIERFARENGMYDLFVTADTSIPAQEKLVEELLQGGAELGIPGILVVREGRVVDLALGARSLQTDLRFFAHFLHRNSLLPDGPAWVEHYGKDKAEFARGERNHDGNDLRGLNLRRAWFQLATFSGANLEGADLRKADLRKANLARANLRRARLEGADLEGTFWLYTTCPDGTNSGPVGGTCEGHLQAKVE